LDGEAREGVSGVEREIYQRTGTNSTRLRQEMGIEVDIVYYTVKDILSIECENRR